MFLDVRGNFTWNVNKLSSCPVQLVEFIDVSGSLGPKRVDGLQLLPMTGHDRTSAFNSRML